MKSVDLQKQQEVIQHKLDDYRLFNTELKCKIGQLSSYYTYVQTENQMNKNMIIVKKKINWLALGYFRSACRHNPRIALYWNVLGVTEMRLGNFKKAEKRFLKSLEVAKNTDALDNLHELRNYIQLHLAVRSYYPSNNISTNGKIEHKIIKINKVTMKEISDVDSAVFNEPFIIRNGLFLFGWNKTRFIYDELINRYSKEKVDFYPHNMREENVRPYFRSLIEASSQLYEGPKDIYYEVDVSESGTYIQWNMNHDVWKEFVMDQNLSMPSYFDNDDIWTKKCFKSTEIRSKFHIFTHWKMMLIGDKGAGMFLHKDTLRTSSWQGQLMGRKRWHICSNSESEYLYHKAGIVSAFSPDYSTYPLFKNATCYLFTLQPGDILYYPYDYWHETLVLDTPTVSISGSIVSTKNHIEVATELDRECKGGNRIFGYDKDLCSALNECFNKWGEIIPPSPEIEEL